MKKENWYTKLWDKNDQKYIAKHGREKFLKNAAKQFPVALMATIVAPISGVVLFLNGLLMILNPESTVYFVFGIIFVSFSGLFFLLLIPMIMLLPFHKRRSKRCKEELLQLKHESTTPPDKFH